MYRVSSSVLFSHAVIPNDVQFGHYRITKQGIGSFIYPRSIHALSSNECSATTKKTAKGKGKKKGGEGEFFSLPTASVKLNQTSIFHFVNQIPCFLVFTHPAKPKTAV